ncbi:glycosyltransferase [Vibrio antiquarius]|uniref:glycosyltransferase n=1 Tax=Vibrio diabolicus subgroup TaxID=2315253 RepID=UPI00265A40B2|nr:glycosyltransferase [Vibrio antiquarius]MCR9847719.1 glycosyltransferase [Vibrio antiquarius]MCR9911439.1 glycosyltransferase [Vibrio antiquarius]
MTSKFSVLCSLYHKEQPSYLEQCFESLEWQTLEANEIVVVHDGPLTDGLYAVLKKWENRLPLKQVVLERNVGLGEALNKGLEACSHDLVARVDTDDINHIDRFDKQVKYMDNNPNVAAASSDVNEFDTDPDEPSRVKKVPCAKTIFAYSLKRNPLNHMATIFRKHAVTNVGSYQHHLYMEDYYLWLRLQAEGYKISNIPETLVSARVGNGMLERRRGLPYALSELKMMREIYKLKLANSPKTALYFSARAFSRLIPATILSKTYERLLR